jgi:hypothetical protein
MATRRHHALAAPFQTLLAALRPSPFHFLTIIHPSHSYMIVNITPQTAYIDMCHTSIPAAYNPQIT